MNKSLIATCLSIVFVFVLFLDKPIGINTVHAEKPNPSHAKWGKIAMKKTAEKYPSAKIYDYLHVKREQRGNYSIETFKLWLDENNNKFEVIVNISFDTKSEKITNVRLQKGSNS
ncbi:MULTISPECIES: DUF3889 domain-containing protein [Priestia]|jgi:hypothetical protein|uniref:DUF3889 domain-containing protein n=1 Tax=Priestia TaxID=2800373 RepID=UPI00099074C8|nr:MULTISPECIES: DUF3889 domain-containing protein [Priestia]AQU77179.1 hypothetical protein BUW91_28675 [Priestia megaterium]MBU8753916.1 YqzG/YhdC family protein [Priestia megaterium]MCU7712809.1 YqzG/YhdC family protein [Priestia megaterium]MCW1045156.1 YqzG/YhdC family protein [Priestia sp. JV24]MDH3187684.1 DUF3889 domain-containing protein [Priestia megaterium]